MKHAARFCCLTFHRAAPTAHWSDLPNRGFYLDLAFLERLLSHLLEAGWSIVTLGEGLRRLEKEHSARLVNFSIDDCYRDTAELVIPLFRRFGVPVTIFVTTGIPDRIIRMRDAGLETVIQSRSKVEDHGISYPLHSLRERRIAFSTIARSWECSSGDADYVRFCENHGEDPDALDQAHAITWPMLQGLRDDPLVEIGAHSVTHPRVSNLDPAQATAELAGSRARLETMLGKPIRYFAFPYGRRLDCGPRDFALASAAGYAAAATTSKGLVRPGIDPYALPRCTLNGEHRNLAFAAAHLSGLSGLLAKVTGRV